MKTCLHCKMCKPFADFYVNKMSRDGCQSECKMCKLARAKARYFAPVQTGVKTCCVCSRTLSVTQYNVAPTYADGRKPECTECHGINDRRQRESRPAHGLLSHARARARRAGLPFDLTIDDIHIPTHCPVLGTPIKMGVGTWRNNSPSLDRHAPERGYVKGNVFVISWRANKLKADATAEELRAVLRYKEAEPVWGADGVLELWRPKA